ncbi:Spondin-1 [Trichinella zimbabwensis]|uniref:Spondin-1 n=1 Tax=Trichinella zimbabwensis TaxID=268475 RepID=A0A0V1GY87_9BILA|nr:Spondin-1 [Trichinella zimbabwensis]
MSSLDCEKKTISSICTFFLIAGLIYIGESTTECNSKQCNELDNSTQSSEPLNITSETVNVSISHTPPHESITVFSYSKHNNSFKSEYQVSILHRSNKSGLMFNISALAEEELFNDSALQWNSSMLSNAASVHPLQFIYFVKLASPISAIQETWSEWTACSVTCGIGIRKRHKSTTLKENEQNTICEEEVQECFHSFCALLNETCILSEWSSWTACSAPCGAGQRTRKRKLIAPVLSNSDTSCGITSETEQCNTISCENWYLTNLCKAYRNIRFPVGECTNVYVECNADDAMKIETCKEQDTVFSEHMQECVSKSRIKSCTEPKLDMSCANFQMGAHPICNCCAAYKICYKGTYFSKCPAGQVFSNEHGRRCVKMEDVAYCSKS